MADQRILVPVANPETADRLLATAIDLALDRDGEILVLHVVVVPMQSSLALAREHYSKENPVADSVERARSTGVPATGRVRFGRSVAKGILAVADEEAVDCVLLGWRGRPRRRDVVLGSYIDEILADAPCDVLVERIDREPSSVTSILVPVAGGPNGAYAAEVAGSIARSHGAAVELVIVVPADADEAAIAAATSVLDEIEPALGSVDAVDRTVLRGPVVETIVDRSRRHDVVVLGAAEGGVLRRALVGDVPESVARRVDGVVVMAKRRRAVAGRLWRWVRELV